MLWESVKTFAMANQWISDWASNPAMFCYIFITFSSVKQLPESDFLDLLSALGLDCRLLLACKIAFISRPPDGPPGFSSGTFVTAFKPQDFPFTLPGGGYGGGNGGADAGGGGGGGGGGADVGGGGGGAEADVGVEDGSTF